MDRRWLLPILQALAIIGIPMSLLNGVAAPPWTADRIAACAFLGVFEVAMIGWFAVTISRRLRF